MTMLGPTSAVGRSDSSDESRPSSIDIVLGVASFALFGWAMAVIEALRWWTPPLGGMLTGLWLLMGWLGTSALVGTAWALRFPRWSYPYLSLAAVFALLYSTAPMPRLPVLGDDIHQAGFWGWRAFVPLGIALAGGLLASRSLRPLQALARHVWCDWTRVTFALYGVMPLVMWVVRDETRGVYPIVHMAVTTTLLTGGTLVYMLASDVRLRAAALLSGFTFSALAAMTGSAVYWHGRLEPWMHGPPDQWYDILRRGLIQLPLWWAVLLAPALLGVLRQVVRTQQAAR